MSSNIDFELEIGQDKLLWYNEAEGFNLISPTKIAIRSKSRTDYFKDPGSTYNLKNAPYLYKEISGNFKATVKVTPEFNETYDAGGLLVMGDESIWAKLAFEETDLGYPAVVSVVTNKFSDDANGIKVDDRVIWLQIIRQDDIFVFHHSKDGRDWQMKRLFYMPVLDKVKIGVFSQSPIGDGTTVTFDNFVIDSILPENIRTGK